MFIILLRFSENRDRASALMEAHNAWIDLGMRDGVFLVVGSLRPNLGGAIVAHGASAADLQHRIARDPFVESGVVRAEVFEIAPSKVDPRLGFLLTWRAMPTTFIGPDCRTPWGRPAERASFARDLTPM